MSGDSVKRVAKNPGRDNAVNKLLDTGCFLTREEIHRALYDYDPEKIDREIDCGIYNGSIRCASHDKLYAWRRS